MATTEECWQTTSKCSPPSVAIIIPNYNGAALLPACLASAVQEAQSLADPAAVMVVDNGSTDGSLELVRRDYPAVRLLALGRNVGFAGACDRAIRASAADYCLLLNNDAWFAPGALATLLRFAVAGDYAFAGPAIVNRDGTYQSGPMALDFLGDPPLLGDPASAAATPFYVSGAALLLRRAAYLALGGFDTRFEFLYEESDLQWRAHLAGLRVGYTAAARVYHLAGGTAAGAVVSPGAATVMARRRMLNARRNNLAMVLKNYSRRSLAVVLPAWLASAAVECLGMLATGHGEQVRIYGEALAWNARALPSTLRWRRRVAQGRVLPDRALRPLAAPPFTRLRTLVRLARSGASVRLR